jgi:2-polyprenyl-3-methyl-5-hydroxy-6-metoxy-1,4-benzoquinol methylase
VVSEHDRDLAKAFDAQAERFEQAKAARDAAALKRLVAFAALPAGTRLLDAGCGPGLVAEAFLEAGCQVVGVDLSAEMIRRARARCQRFGDRARFEQRALGDPAPEAPFDACASRNVLHHVEDPRAFLARQVELLRPGGVLLAQDALQDPEPARGAWVQEIQRARDRTHVRNLRPGELVDLFAGAGLEDLRLSQDELLLDWDEWFDRGTPAAPKEEVRARLLAGTAWGFAPRLLPGGSVEIRVLRAVLRGVKPGSRPGRGP